MAQSCAPGEEAPGRLLRPSPRGLIRCTHVLRAEIVDSRPCLRRPSSPPTAGVASAPLREPRDRGSLAMSLRLGSRESLPRSALPAHRPTPLSRARRLPASCPSSPFHLPRLLRPSLQPPPTPSSSSPGALRALSSGHSISHTGLLTEGPRRPRKPSQGPEAPEDAGKCGAAAAALLLPPLLHTCTRDTPLPPAAAASQTRRRAVTFHPAPSARRRGRRVARSRTTARRQDFSPFPQGWAYGRLAPPTRCDTPVELAW